jgi:hypothetical protein
MASWRDGLSDETQSQVDRLLEPALDFAEKALIADRSIYPFAIALSTADEFELHMLGAPEQGETDGAVIVEQVTDALRHHRDGLTSYALVVDVRLRTPDSDAAELRIEHRAGAAITVHVPYRFDGGSLLLALDAMIVSPGERVVWP